MVYKTISFRSSVTHITTVLFIHYIFFALIFNIGLENMNLKMLKKIKKKKKVYSSNVKAVFYVHEKGLI